MELGGGGGGDRKGGLPYYIEAFLEIPHDAPQEKNPGAFIFLLLPNMCYTLIKI